MSEGEGANIARGGGAHVVPFPAAAPKSQVTFNRDELRLILNLYGRMVAGGEWRDYAMDFGREKAVFSVFRRASEMPLYRIVKEPALARKQGAWSVVAASGLVMKRGQDLDRVLRVLEPLRVVTN
jgi:hypothetical protein